MPPSPIAAPRPAPAPRAVNRRHLLLLAAIVLVGIGLRAGIFIFTTQGNIDSDAALYGLMARHIIEGERPVFFYGQQYGGSGVAWLLAILFWLFGTSVATDAAGWMLVAALFLVGTWLLAGEFVSGPGRLLAVGLAACGPATLIWANNSGRGYGETLALGTFFFWAWLRWRREPRLLTAAAAGLLGGLLLWNSGMAMVYLAAAGLAAALDWRRAFRFRANRWGFLLVWFGLGALPWLVANLGSGGGSFRFAADVVRPPGDQLDHLLRICRLDLPASLGAGPYIESLPAAGSASGPGWFLFVLTLAAVVRFSRRRPLRENLPLLFTLTVLSAYLLSQFNQPRYFTPLFSVIPLMAAGAIDSLPGRWPGRFAAVGFWCGLALWSSLTCWGPVNTASRADEQRLINCLQQEGVTAGYAEYWDAYRLSLLSGEAVTLTPVLPFGTDRYLNYTQRARAAATDCFIFRDAVAAQFAARLENSPDHRGAGGYRAVRAGRWTIFLIPKHPRNLELVAALDDWYCRQYL